MLEGHQQSFDHSPHPGFQLHYPGEETKHDSSPVLDHLSHLVKTIIGSLPVKDPHPKQGQQRRIINLPPVDHTKPFSPVNHMGPKVIIKEQIQEDIIPPAMVCSCLILSFLTDPMECILGDL